MSQFRSAFAPLRPLVKSNTVQIDPKETGSDGLTLKNGQCPVQVRRLIIFSPSLQFLSLYFSFSIFLLFFLFSFLQYFSRGHIIVQYWVALLKCAENTRIPAHNFQKRLHKELQKEREIEVCIIEQVLYLDIVKGAIKVLQLSG